MTRFPNILSTKYRKYFTKLCHIIMMMMHRMNGSFHDRVVFFRSLECGETRFGLLRKSPNILHNFYLKSILEITILGIIYFIWKIIIFDTAGM